MAPRLHISFTTISSPWHRAAEAAAGARWRSDVDRNVAGSPDQSKPSESARDSKSASTRDPSNGTGALVSSRLKMQESEEFGAASNSV